MGPGLERGYTVATSNSGHHALDVTDASRAYNNLLVERDWAWRSIGETNWVAISLLDAFYKEKAEYSYFQGCSNGARMANMAALKYPGMFSGIISGAPAIDYTGLVAVKMIWLTQANMDEERAALRDPRNGPLRPVTRCKRHRPKQPECLGSP